MIRQGYADIGDLLLIWRVEDCMYDHHIDNVKSLQKAIKDCKDVVIGFSKNKKKDNGFKSLQSLAISNKLFWLFLQLSLIKYKITCAFPR